MKIDKEKIIADVVKQYKKDRKFFADNNFYLDDTVSRVLGWYDIFNDFELQEKVLEEAKTKLGKNVKLFEGMEYE